MDDQLNTYIGVWKVLIVLLTVKGNQRKLFSQDFSACNIIGEKYNRNGFFFRKKLFDYIFYWLPASCSNIVDRHGLDGSIESPGFPENYPHNYNITWSAYGPLDAISLSVTIVKFDIFKDSECHDFLQVWTFIQIVLF